MPAPLSLTARYGVTVIKYHGISDIQTLCQIKHMVN